MVNTRGMKILQFASHYQKEVHMERRGDLEAVWDLLRQMTWYKIFNELPKTTWQCFLIFICTYPEASILALCRHNKMLRHEAHWLFFSDLVWVCSGRVISQLDGVTRQHPWRRLKTRNQERKQLKIPQQNQTHSCGDECRLPIQRRSRVKVSGIELLNVHQDHSDLLQRTCKKRQVSFLIDVVVNGQVCAN